MNQLFFYIVPVAVILGFMILIHEFGHYAVAKLLGVRVEQFAIGFGKRLIGFRKGETDYRINAIPLGGYVKMSGENPSDEHTGDPREFMSHSRWHRFLIAIAGPMMNILFAVFLLTVVYKEHYEIPVFWDQPAVIGWVDPKSPAAKTSALPGDKIIQIDGIQNPTWEQAEERAWLSPNQPLTFTLLRGAQTIQGTVVPVPKTSSEIGSAGWFPNERVIATDIEANMPAAEMGLREGDRIVAVDGQPVPSIQSMIERLQQSKTKAVALDIMRDGKSLTLTGAPVLSTSADGSEKQYRLGFRNLTETKVSKLSLPEAFDHSVENNKHYSVILLELVGKMIHGKMLKSVSGPIGIAQQAGAAAQEKGWLPLLELTAGISLNLGIFNLLPIPIMDGGVILLLFIESLMRRDISLQIKERIYQAAFVFLILFAAMVIYNDIAKTLAQRLP
jgi:regulator of sigma E protease